MEEVTTKEGICVYERLSGRRESEGGEISGREDAHWECAATKEMRVRPAGELMESSK